MQKLSLPDLSNVALKPEAMPDTAILPSRLILIKRVSRSRFFARNAVSLGPQLPIPKL